MNTIDFTPGALVNKSKEQIEAMAEKIAEETYVTTGKLIAWQENRDLRYLVGGRFEKYKFYSKILIMAYTKRQMELFFF